MRSLYDEAKKTVVLAVPLALGMVGQNLMQVVDAAMIGRVGVVPLAAAAFGSNVTMVFMIIGYGLCSAVHVLVAQEHGRRNAKGALDYLFTGMVTLGVYGLICAFVVIPLLPITFNLGQPEAVAIEAMGYIVLITWSVLPLMLYSALKHYFEARGRPWEPFWVFVGASVLNVVLNWVLIFGELGFPAMGLDGAGLATLIARIVMLFWLVGILFQQQSIRLAAIRLTRTQVKRMLSIGLPSAAHLFFEVGMFIFAAIMVGWISAETLAAHHISFSYAGMVFMVALGISFATTIRVGEAVGQEDSDLVRRISLSSGLLTIGLMLISAIVTFALRNVIPYFFTDELVVIAIASQMLIVAALFQISDGGQIVVMGALRGLGDVNLPTVFAFLGYWAVGMPVAYVCAFTFGLDGIGIWIGILSGIVSASAMITGRLWWMCNRSQLQRVFARGKDGPEVVPPAESH